MTKPRDYDVDAGISLTFDTLTNRGFEEGVVIKALDAYEGDLWFDVFGPAIDQAADLIGLGPHPAEEEGWSP